MLRLLSRRLLPSATLSLAVVAFVNKGENEHAQSDALVDFEASRLEVRGRWKNRPKAFGLQPSQARELDEVKNLKPPNFGGKWVLSLEKSQHEELVEIMAKIGVPSYLIRMGRLSRSKMEVTQSDDNVLVEEVICQLGGMYKNKVQLFTDEREFVGKHPLDGSRIVTKTKWQSLPKEELEPCSVQESHVMCCVSEATYEKYGHRQRIVRFLENNGDSFHSINTLYPSNGEAPITAHRILEREA